MRGVKPVRVVLVLLGGVSAMKGVKAVRIVLVLLGGVKAVWRVLVL
jgi:hypothetical protein